MFQIFLNSFSSAMNIVALVSGWVAAFLVAAFFACILAFFIGFLFDCATRFLRWFWKLTGHQPRGKIQCIIMGQKDDT